MRLFCAIVLCLSGFGLGAGNAYTQSSLNVEYILDASNSMNGSLPSGELKIDAAKRVLCNLIDNILAEAKDANIGLRIYGANFDPASTKETACKDSVLAAAIGPVKVSSIKNTIMVAKASGYTPIAYSLELAGKDFPAGPENTNIIVLVSDGKETCGGDPAAAAKRLVEQGFGIKIYSIGFDVDAEARKQLEAVAEVTGGAYYDAKDADQLQKSLEEIKQRSFEEYEAAGEAVAPALWISDAPEIGEGDYKNKIGMREAQFYKIKVYKGQQVKAALIVKKTPYQAMNSKINQTFSVELLNDVWSELASGEYIAEGNPADPVTFKVQWAADKTGWVYIVISATGNHDADGNPNAIYPEGTVPEPSSYTLKVKIKGAVPPEEKTAEFPVLPSEVKKGGAGFENAAIIGVGVINDDTIMMGETRYFKLPLTEGLKEIAVTAIFTKPWYSAMNSRINMKYTLKIYDEDWVAVNEDFVTIGKNPARPFSINLRAQAKDNEELYITLTASGNFSR